MRNSRPFAVCAAQGDVVDERRTASGEQLTVPTRPRLLEQFAQHGEPVRRHVIERLPDGLLNFVIEVFEEAKTFGCDLCENDAPVGRATRALDQTAILQTVEKAGEIGVA